MARNALKFSTMVGEIFEIRWPQMARNALKLFTMVGENLKYSGLKWLEMHLNCLPWLENFLSVVIEKSHDNPMFLRYPMT